jgi:hypothetical protein
MSRYLQILIISKNSNDTKIVTINWNNLSEFKEKIMQLEKYSEEEYGRFYREWDDEECTREENEVLYNY